MIEVPKNIKKLNTYKPGKPAEKIAQEKGFEKYAVLWNSESCYGMSPLAKEEIQKAVESAYYYPDPLSMETRKVIGASLNRSAEEIAISNGSEGILFNLIQGFCSGNDEILTSESTFAITYLWAQINNVPCRKIPMTEDFRFDLDNIAKNINDNTKLIYLANANNPTGCYISKEEFERFIKKVPEDVIIVMDEAYFEYANELADDFPNSIEYDIPNLITVRSLSKAYGLAGIRVGYAAAKPELINVLNEVKLIFEPSAIVQAAAKGGVRDVDYVKKITQNNKDGMQFY
ncbi:MAG: histidinol-phosphate transaminase, partial [Flavobacteriales bacterium]